MDCCCKWHLCCFHPISLGSAMLCFLILAPRTCHQDLCTSNHVLEICEHSEAIFVKLFSVWKSSWHNVFCQWLKWWSRESSSTGQLLPPAKSHSSSSNSALSKPMTNLSTRNFGVKPFHQMKPLHWITSWSPLADSFNLLQLPTIISRWMALNLLHAPELTCRAFDAVVGAPPNS